MVEYNQCQATLKTLYELGIPGKVEEFTAYRILMLLHGRNRSGGFCGWTILSHFYSTPLPLRIKSLCRSANTQTESRSSCSSRTHSATSTVDGKLPCSIWIVHDGPKHGRIYYGPFHWPGKDQSVDGHHKGVSLRSYFHTCPQPNTNLWQISDNTSSISSKCSRVWLAWHRTGIPCGSFSCLLHKSSCSRQPEGTRM